MSAFREQMAKDLAAIHGDQGEQVTYTSATETYPLTAIFRGLTPDDMVSEHVRADAVVCEIQEAELHGEPQRQDVIERTLPFGSKSLEVVDRFRDESGVWRLTCQDNIRVVP